MRPHLAATYALLASCAFLGLAGCASQADTAPVTVTETVTTAGPLGVNSYEQIDVFGLKRAGSRVIVNPSPSQSVMVNLADPQSFWDGAFDQNWLEDDW